MRNAHEEVGRFIKGHRPDVVIYDVGMPYPSSCSDASTRRRPR
jgi:hypothetical protein